MRNYGSALRAAHAVEATFRQAMSAAESSRGQVLQALQSRHSQTSDCRTLPDPLVAHSRDDLRF